MASFVEPVVSVLIPGGGSRRSGYFQEIWRFEESSRNWASAHSTLGARPEDALHAKETENVAAREAGRMNAALEADGTVDLARPRRTSSL